MGFLVLRFPKFTVSMTGSILAWEVLKDLSTKLLLKIWFCLVIEFLSLYKYRSYSVMYVGISVVKFASSLPFKGDTLVSIKPPNV